MRDFFGGLAAMLILVAGLGLCLLVAGYEWLSEALTGEPPIAGATGTP
jgi:hypothetical protein